MQEWSTITPAGVQLVPPLRQLGNVTTTSQNQCLIRRFDNVVALPNLHPIPDHNHPQDRHRGKGEVCLNIQIVSIGFVDIFLLNSSNSSIFAEFVNFFDFLKLCRFLSIFSILKNYFDFLWWVVDFLSISSFYRFSRF